MSFLSWVRVDVNFQRETLNISFSSELTNSQPRVYAVSLPTEKEQEPKLTCEYCGWVDFAYTFKGSKRFCSMVCAKRQVTFLVLCLLI